SLIRERIVNLYYQPGDPLNEVKLAEEFGVSRTPIREALIRLSSEKSVIIIPRAGARVADINLHDFKVLIEIRLILERGAVRLAAMKATKEQIHRLEELNMEVEQADYEDLSVMLDYDVQFHKIIRDIADNSYLSKYLTIVMNQFIRIERIISYKPAIFQTDLPKFIETLKQKDPDEMEKLIEHHLENIVKRVKDYIKTI
ncbi:MAG TPA: GntR family transcriptional regulator, partial [Proteobacteria bacterium]|nr:GntR family transcriptional regulator [Pseudomonadota bacterium]